MKATSEAAFETAIESVLLAEGYARVAERVAHGGHAIPVADIERRFPRRLRHLLENFSHRVDHCTCFMNNGEHPALVFDQRGDQGEIAHGDCCQLLTEEAGK